MILRWVILLIGFCSFFEKVSAQDLQLILPFGHTETINSIAISDDFERVLSVSDDRLIKLWDIKSGRLLATLNDHFCEVVKGCFFPNSKAFVTAGQDGQVKIWKANGELQQTIHTELEEDDVRFLNLTEFVLSKDGNLCVVGSLEGNITVWNTTTGALIFKVHASSESIHRVFINPNSTEIVVIPVKGNPQVIRLLDGQLLAELTGHAGKIKTATFSTKGDAIFIGGVQNEILQYSAKDYSLQNRFIGHEETFLGNGDKEMRIIVNNDFWINDLRCNADDSRMLSVSDDGTGILWNLKDGQIVQRLYHGAGQVKKCDISPNGNSVTTSSLKFTKVWDVSSGHEMATFEGGSGAFIDHGNQIVTTSSVNNIKNSNSFVFWNTLDYQLSKSFIHISNAIVEILDSNDDRKIVAKQLIGGIRIWDAKNGKVTNPSKDADVVSYGQDEKGDYLVFCREDSVIVLYDLQNLREVLRSKCTSGIPREIQIDNTRNWLLFIFEEGRMEIRKLSDLSLNHPFQFKINIATAEFTTSEPGVLISLRSGEIRWFRMNDWKLLGKWTNKSGQTYGATMSNNGRYLMSYGSDGYKIQDLSKRSKTIMSEDEGAFYSGKFSKNGVFAIIDNHVLSIEDNSTDELPYFVKVYTDSSWKYRLYTTNELYNDSILVLDWGQNTIENSQRYVHNNEVTGVKFTNDASSFYSVSSDNSMKKWKTESGEWMATFYALSKEDYLVLGNNGYYQCSKNIANLIHYVTNDLKVVGFDQLDSKNNRPDLILKSLNNVDTTLINSYYKAYLKRIKKLNIDTLAFVSGYSFPECSLTSNLSAVKEKQEKWLKVKCHFSDSITMLDRFNIWINEVPLYGERGFSLRGRNLHSFDTTFSIQLSQGENRIETSVTNTNAIESFRSPLFVEFNPKDAYVPKIYFIGIGIEKFTQPNHDLAYAVKDVRDLANKLKSKMGGSLQVDTLFNENVTIENVRQLKKRLMNTNVNDKVIISYSGHGLLSKDYDYFLSSYSVDFRNPENGGIPYELLEELLDSIPARQKLMWIDACHSGEVDKDEVLAMEANQDTSGIKGFVFPTDYKNKMGLKNSFQLMQELFVNVQKGSGATIISAAAGNQFALEGGKLENGYFTHTLLQFMQNNPSGSVNEMKQYVYKEVERLSKGRQQPTSRRENLELDWRIW